MRYLAAWIVFTALGCTSEKREEMENGNGALQPGLLIAKASQTGSAFPEQCMQGDDPPYEGQVDVPGVLADGKSRLHGGQGTVVPAIVRTGW